jgi:hypothetical protein
MIQPRTTWAAQKSPYTGKVPTKEVPVPTRPSNRKGHTKYDEEFERLLTFKTAIETHEDNFQTLRRAIKRFIDFRELNGKVIVRQQLNPQTRDVTLWLEKKK